MPEVLSRLSLPVDPVYGDDVSRKKDLAAVVPSIGQNGNWFIGGADTGEPSRGPAGPPSIVNPRGVWSEYTGDYEKYDVVVYDYDNAEHWSRLILRTCC